MLPYTAYMDPMGKWLVDGIPTLPKNMNASWDDDIPNIWKF